MADRLERLYPAASIADREAVRLLFKEFRAVRWAMWPKTLGAETTQGLRDCLLHLAMTDGAGDFRDDIVALSEIRVKAVASADELKALAREFGAMSSERVARLLGQVLTATLKPKPADQ